jgi:hypothetical protein
MIEHLKYNQIHKPKIKTMQAHARYRKATTSRPTCIMGRHHEGDLIIHQASTEPKSRQGKNCVSDHTYFNVPNARTSTEPVSRAIILRSDQIDTPLLITHLRLPWTTGRPGTCSGSGGDDEPAGVEGGAVSDIHGALAPVQVEEGHEPAAAAGSDPPPALGAPGRFCCWLCRHWPELSDAVVVVVPGALGEGGHEGVVVPGVAGRRGWGPGAPASRGRAERRRRQRGASASGRGQPDAGRVLGHARLALPRKWHERGGGTGARGQRRRRAEGRRRAGDGGG